MNYTIRTPLDLNGNGNVNFLTSGALEFNNATVNDFVTTDQGDFVYANGSNEMVKLPIGGAGDVISTAGNNPAWVASTTLEGTILPIVSLIKNTEQVISH